MTETIEDAARLIADGQPVSSDPLGDLAQRQVCAVSAVKLECEGGWVALVDVLKQSSPTSTLIGEMSLVLVGIPGHWAVSYRGGGAVRRSLIVQLPHRGLAVTGGGELALRVGSKDQYFAFITGICSLPDPVLKENGNADQASFHVSFEESGWFLILVHGTSPAPKTLMLSSSSSPSLQFPLAFFQDLAG